ncbi:hypothetical protein L7F22_051993 [Adiantum nelumboides]|nr:hypothetical protein [Adiantum nelumboides]
MAHHHQLSEANTSNVIVDPEVLRVYEGRRTINELIAKLQEHMRNPHEVAEISKHLQEMLQETSLGQGGEDVERPLTETPINAPNALRPEEEIQAPTAMHIDQGYAIQPQLSKEKYGNGSPYTSDSDVAPRRRKVKRLPSPDKRKRSTHTPTHEQSKKKAREDKKKKRRKTPSSPSSSSSSSDHGSSTPPSSDDEESDSSSKRHEGRRKRKSYAAKKRSHNNQKFKGGKSITFLTYDGTFGATNKVLAFIQQYDAAFGDEGFSKSSKLCNVAMHFQKSARQWWASLRANGTPPKTWKALREAIMKQFLSSDAKDKVLTTWQSLKMMPNETVHKYIDKFWDLHN